MNTADFITQLSEGVLSLVKDSASFSDEATLGTDEYFALMVSSDYKSYVRYIRESKGFINYNTRYRCYDHGVETNNSDGLYLLSKYYMCRKSHKGRTIIVSISDLTKAFLLAVRNIITPNPVIPDVPVVPSSPLLDIDGNEYTTVTINGQEWIIENLRTTKYADGSDIPNVIAYEDWFLLSKDELALVYTNLVLFAVGDISGVHWSSSEVNATTVWTQNMNTGVQSMNIKGSNFVTQGGRKFTTTDIYSLRDAGPAGGWIFHVIDNGDGTFTYYELSPEEQNASGKWSNIENQFAGASGTVVGTGQANTTTIVEQVGHETSAAYWCDRTRRGLGIWGTLTSGAYCWYSNDIAYKEFYGALYNWFAINDAAGLAYFERDGVQEAGWRVASKTDYDNLATFAGGAATAGAKLKGTGTTYWTAPNTGATDQYGFKALPGGYRSGTIIGFQSMNDYIHLWSSTEDDAADAWKFYITVNIDNFSSSDDGKVNGFSIRCVRDI